MWGASRKWCRSVGDDDGNGDGDGDDGDDHNNNSFLQQQFYFIF